MDSTWLSPSLGNSFGWLRLGSCWGERGERRLVRREDIACDVVAAVDSITIIAITLLAYSTLFDSIYLSFISSIKYHSFISRL